MHASVRALGPVTFCWVQAVPSQVHVSPRNFGFDPWGPSPPKRTATDVVLDEEVELALEVLDWEVDDEDTVEDALDADVVPMIPVKLKSENADVEVEVDEVVDAPLAPEELPVAPKKSSLRAPHAVKSRRDDRRTAGARIERG
jgi:hypothetical protein